MLLLAREGVESAEAGASNKQINNKHEAGQSISLQEVPRFTGAPRIQECGAGTRDACYGEVRGRRVGVWEIAGGWALEDPPFFRANRLFSFSLSAFQP